MSTDNRAPSTGARALTETNPTATSIEVMWRPGCPFCASLRRELSRAGVVTTEHDIWASAEAAARVRKATGGDETVPTVFVGDRALVNPSVRQVVDAIRAADPDYRPISTTTHASARLGTSHVAASDDIVTVEGNAYFPLASVPEGVLQPSSTTSVCPWKGIASYYDVHVDGRVVHDGAFTYRHPSPLARRIKGRVAFWNGIKVDTTRPGTD